MNSRYTDFSDGSERRSQRESSWPIAPGDSDEAALREGWAALDQLIDKAGAGRLDLAASARLVREVERRVRRRRQLQWGGLVAAAAVVFIAVSLAWRPFGGTVVQPGAPEQIAKKPAEARPLALVTGTKPKTSPIAVTRPQATPTAVAPALVSPTNTVLTNALPPASFVDAASDGPQYWRDPLDEDLQSARAYAGEVEHSWRRRGDRWAGLRDQMEQLQWELNESPL